MDMDIIQQLSTGHFSLDPILPGNYFDLDPWLLTKSLTRGPIIQSYAYSLFDIIIYSFITGDILNIIANQSIWMLYSKIHIDLGIKK